MNPLEPSASTLIKLGSLIAHLDEAVEVADVNEFDAAAISQLKNDPEVRDWMQAMDAMAFLPKKRS